MHLPATVNNHFPIPYDLLVEVFNTFSQFRLNSFISSYTWFELKVTISLSFQRTRVNPRILVRFVMLCLYFCPSFENYVVYLSSIYSSSSSIKNIFILNVFSYVNGNLLRLRCGLYLYCFKASYRKFIYLQPLIIIFPFHMIFW
jgi:hypothetical protein